MATGKALSLTCVSFALHAPKMLISAVRRGVRMPENHKPLLPEVTEILLIAKSILDRLKSETPASPDRHSIVVNILLAHDAAELALSAVAQQCGKLPSGKYHYLMDYFAPLKTLHQDKEVPGRGYFDQLNRARQNLKHVGVFPDTQQ